MVANMRTSTSGLDLIKTFEGFRPDPLALNEAKWLIGYGHLHLGEQPGRLTRAEADILLKEYDLIEIEDVILETILLPLNQNEFDALASFAFNLGADTFRTSDVAVLLNAGDRLGAVRAMGLWNGCLISGETRLLDSLARRRAAEQALFLKVPGHMPATASALYRPVRATSDIEELRRAPQQWPVRHGGAAPAPAELSGRSSRPEQAGVPDPSSGGRRLVRTLGAETDGSADQISPEAITRAVSDLARLTQKGDEAVDHKTLDEPVRPADNAVERIDDLEEVTLSDIEVARAVEESRRLAEKSLAWLTPDVLGLVLIAFAGFGLAFAGLFGAIQLARYPSAAADFPTQYGPALAYVSGGLVAVMMTYALTLSWYGRKPPRR